jgi:transcription initiation factor TFIID subunit TAF12
MPGLLRGVARVAVVAGTATAVSNRVSRRQGGRWARQDQSQQDQAQQDQPQQDQPAQDQPQQSAAPPPADPLAQLKELGELKKDGVLTDAEFQDQKQRILSAAT